MNITIRLPLEKAVGALVLETAHDQDTVKISLGEATGFVKRSELMEAMSLLSPPHNYVLAGIPRGQ